MSYSTLKVRYQDVVCFIEIDRPAARNAINSELIRECSEVLDLCRERARIVVLSGSPEYFCFGADFQALAGQPANTLAEDSPAGRLYDCWLRMASGPYITIAHVRGKVNAGGMGFVAASDIVLADERAQFSLSELLFGLHPACVMPFLIRRIGFQRSHYLTLSTAPISVQQAHSWGLVDAFERSSEGLLRRHLLRLRRLSASAVARYKSYMNGLAPPVGELKARAVAANLEFLSDPVNLAGITRYVERGVFPWERE